MGFEFRVLKERRQWALSSVSGPPCFGLCSCFARFFKNHKKIVWFIGVSYGSLKKKSGLLVIRWLVFFYV